MQHQIHGIISPSICNERRHGRDFIVSDLTGLHSRKTWSTKQLQRIFRHLLMLSRLERVSQRPHTTFADNDVAAEVMQAGHASACGVFLNGPYKA